MLKNLKAALDKKEISLKVVASLINTTDKTVRNKINGKTEFNCPEAIKISAELFPEYKLEYLFASGGKGDKGDDK